MRKFICDICGKEVPPDEYQCTFEFGPGTTSFRTVADCRVEVCGVCYDLLTDRVKRLVQDTKEEMHVGD